MRRLGTHDIGTLSSNPAIAVIVYSSLDQLPKFALIQEACTDIPIILIGGIKVQTYNIINDVTITSTRPQSGGGLRRNTVEIQFITNKVTGLPLAISPIQSSIYYGGTNFDDFFFAIYSADRTKLNLDVKLGACYGLFKVDNTLSWSEKDGMQSLSLIDTLLAQPNLVGATDEPIPDFFFIYNPWYQSNFIPKAYGQVPRIKILNAFPSFSVKKFAANINGTVKSVYSNVSSTIILEDNVDDASLLLQVQALGGYVRVRMKDNEVIYGTLSYDSTLHTITLNVITRNTYYAQVQAYNDSLDGRSPDQWGTTPSWSSVRFSPFQTVIPNVKDVLQDQNSFMQADIWFYRNTEPMKGLQFTNVVCQAQGILAERKDVVIHTYWPDPDYPTLQSQGSLSGFYNNISNSTYLPSTDTPVWPIAAFEVMKFRTTTQPLRLFFNNPDVAVPGSGVVGDKWNLVNVEPDTIDTSCYVRNGFSQFNSDNVYCEGEGKLIKIPEGNVTVTEGTFYGLTNMVKITLTDAPLDMNIGAKSNIVYTDALYKSDTDENRSERILYEILKEGDNIYQLAGVSINNTLIAYLDNYMPYIGFYCNKETIVTDIIDRICFQCGITLRWDYGQFDIEIAGQSFNIEETITIEDQDYIKVLAPFTDENEMLENTAQIQVDVLRTQKYEDGFEYIPLYFKVQYGGWEDPFYKPTMGQTNRNIKPKERVVSYTFDLINDTSSFQSAIAASLSIGHASGYALAQRRLITSMSLHGCRWEAMNPILFKRFPLVTDDTGSNALYTEADDLVYIKREDGKRYIMGGVCSVDQVTYKFSVLDPVVDLVARMSQTFVAASGISVYNPPGPPGPPDTPNNDPNAPPQGNGGHGIIGGGTGVGGTSELMPIIISPISAIDIDSSDVYERDFTVTVDAGWIFDLGFSYRLYVEDTYSETGEATLDDFGAQIVGAYAGVFPDKINDSYVAPVYDCTLKVDYKWLYRLSEGQPIRVLTIVCIRRFHINRDPSSDYSEDMQRIDVVVTRRELSGIIGS